MTLYVLYTRPIASGRWHRKTARLDREEAILAHFNTTARFEASAVANLARIDVHDVAKRPTKTIRPVGQEALEEWLLHDNRTVLRKVAYDAKWHLLRTSGLRAHYQMRGWTRGRYKRISSSRAAALKGAFNRWCAKGCRPAAPLIEL